MGFFASHAWCAYVVVVSFTPKIDDAAGVNADVSQLATAVSGSAAARFSPEHYI